VAQRLFVQRHCRRSCRHAFGEYAADPASARRLQHRMRARIEEKDLMPATEDLPELPEREFQRASAELTRRRTKK